MTESNKLDRKIILATTVLAFILLAVLLFVIITDSPKFSEPKVSYSENSSELVISSISNNDENDIFPIGINTADIDELQLIPNIGPVTAELIIDYRNEYGTILDFDELLSIDGIGDKTVEILEEYCIIN